MGLIEDESYPCEFGYAVEGQHTWLMDRIALPSANLRSAKRNANDFALRALATRRFGTINHFAAFVDLSRQSAQAEESLLAVQTLAEVIDLADERAAIETVGELLHV